MSLQKLAIFILLFISISIHAQSESTYLSYTNVSSNLLNHLEDNSDLLNTSQSFILKHSTENNIKNSFSQEINTAQNFLTTNNINSDELNEDINALLNLKKDRHPMEKTGRVLTFIGVPLAIVGAILVANADELYYQCNNGDCSGDAGGGFGIVMLGAGSGLSITGAILWISGSKK